MNRIDAVIKIGGELVLNKQIHAPLLKELLKNVRSGKSLLVICGGGVMSDHVRSLYSEKIISDEAAHWMAILAMDQMAHILVDNRLDVKIIRNPSQVKESVEHGILPVLQVYSYLKENDELPHNWSVTADSIAAYIALKIKTRFLILVKDVNGLYPSPKIEEGQLIPVIKASSLNLDKHKIIDSYLPKILSLKPDYKCWLINGYHPERITEILATGKTTGTEILI
ncbi:MAG: hypothetical protein QW327_04930 [Candidatus Odinarchaeota archaeon]